MEVCKTDVTAIIRYLDDAAKAYDTLPGRKTAWRAWLMRQLAKKLYRKLNQPNK